MGVRWGGATLAVATVLLAGCGWADDGGRDRDPANQPGYVLPDDRDTRPDQRDDGRPDEPDRRDRHVVTGPADGLREATFAMIKGSDVVRVRAVDLGTGLYRISTPTDSKVVPSVHVEGGTVYAGLAGTGLAGSAVVTVELSRSVRWHVRLGGGAGEETVDLTGGQVGSVDLSAGTNRAEVTLPPAAGTVRVTMSGGAGQLLVHLSGTAPVRVRTGNGAGTVAVDGEVRSGVVGGTVLKADGWDTATDRYDVDATAGVSTLTVDRR